jgi:release factor glutamine methyltransferase
MTLRAAVFAATRRLAGAGVDTPARDARLLVARAAGVPVDRLIVEDHRPLTDDAAAALQGMLAAREARQPMAQILGERLFWGRSFRVTPDVLDPRPETEMLVAAALEAPFARVVDLGVGSGAILLSLLADRPDATGVGADVSPAALAVARENAGRLGVAADLVLSDWWAGVAGRFDLVVANPPYITAAEMADLAPEVRDWEPHLALTPGGDGLGAYRAIAGGVMAHLAPGGRLIVEIGPAQGAAVAGLFAAAGLTDVQVRPDLDRRDRLVQGRHPG